MSDLSIGERAIIERSETAAEKTAATADGLRLAVAALRYVLEVGNQASLDAIAQDSGVETDFDQLARAAATTDGLADREQSIAGSLSTRGADLIRERGMLTWIRHRSG